MSPNQTSATLQPEQTQGPGETDRKTLTTTKSSLTIGVTPLMVATEPLGVFDDGDSSQSSGSLAVSQNITHANFQWLPLTLHLPFLVFSILLSFSLSVLVFSLTTYSVQNLGLITDHGSRALFFGWRFAPTLVATTYGICMASIVGDVRRTEVYARLSRSKRISTKYTLCFPARAWWYDPFDALSKKKNGGIQSWALFFASSAFIIALVSSPLSAGLLSPVIIQIPAHSRFQQPSITKNFSWNTNMMDSIMFRTISGAILGKPTSAWLSTDLAVLPFWPTDYGDDPLALDMNVGPRQWVAQSVAYQTEFDCIPLILTDTHNTTVNGLSSSEKSRPGFFHQLESSDGCIITMKEIVQYSSGPPDTWPSLNASLWGSASDLSPMLTAYGSSNSTKECGSRTMLLMRTSQEFQAQICSARYYWANVSVNMSIVQSSRAIVDLEEFMKIRQPLDEVLYNISTLEASFFRSDPSWDTKFRKVSTTNTYLKGPIIAISAGSDYGNDVHRMMEDPVLVKKASAFYQQFFGEMLFLALQPSLRQPAAARYFSANVYLTERRIVVNEGIGITLGIILMLSGCCISVVAYQARLTRRHLNLAQDPGMLTVVTSLIAGNEQTKDLFAETDRTSKEAILARLTVSNAYMSDGKLFSSHSAEHVDKDDTAHTATGVQDPRPAVLRTWMGFLFLAYIIALFAAILMLFQTSRTDGLYQSAFVFRRDLKVLRAAATFTPYSIVPTLFALGLKLWYAAIGDTSKRLQPYLLMLRKPMPLLESVLTEYANTPTAFVSAKAVRNSHWILALIGISAFATEAFTVGMSALWDLEIQSSHHSLNISRELQMRSTPRLFTIGAGYLYGGSSSGDDTVRTSVLQSVYDATIQSWLYSAAIELSQSGGTPPWSKDMWSFAPIDLGNVSTEARTLRIELPNRVGRSSNITFVTPAIRAGLRCEQVDTWTNTSTWVGSVDFTDKSSWNDTNKPLGLDRGYVLKGFANIGTGVGFLKCCANETHGAPGESAIGHWSNVAWGEWNPFRTSIVVKWIVGSPLNGTYKTNKYMTDPDRTGLPLFVWPEQPKLAAINCTPIIEHATANVSVDLETGVVQEYNMLDTPQVATEAWSDPYITRNVSLDYSDGYSTFPRAPGVVSNYTNITVSWGHIFLDALTLSSTAKHVSIGSWQPETEDLTDRMFNFRYAGLNADFMSYCMLQLAKGDKTALLDMDTLGNLANETFGVFFKHFASSNVSTRTGGQAFQPIGEKLPWNLGIAVGNPGGILPPEQQGAFAVQNETVLLERRINATISVPIEQLVMSPIAVYLCISILILLCCTTVVIYTVNRPQLKALPRDVDTLASTIAFVYGSEKLLRWVQDLPSLQPSNLRSEDTKHMMARLGPFTDSKGKQRWGIELVEPESVQKEHDCAPVREWNQVSTQQPSDRQSDDHHLSEPSTPAYRLHRAEQQDEEGIELLEMRRLLVENIDRDREWDVSDSDAELGARATRNRS